MNRNSYDDVIGETVLLLNQEVMLLRDRLAEKEVLIRELEEHITVLEAKVFHEDKL